jgi:hypothetical protein
MDSSFSERVDKIIRQASERVVPSMVRENFHYNYQDHNPDFNTQYRKSAGSSKQPKSKYYNPALYNDWESDRFDD